ncbi:hypothetical protein UC34_08385 [Pandoraea vervacti]|uniref:Uncharacterized protein n=2 Tax=Pandoraea vervacti TaxID=656178 RepID=A0ABN4FN90_9BURK|nr:hypothetical protein UC34_08385 [Pandoraea vervacti]
MGTLFGGIGGASSAPVLIRGTRSPCDCAQSFGSDFARLGALPAGSVGACGKPWQTYPSRRQSAEDAKGLSFGQWQAQRARDQCAADDLRDTPLIPGQIAQRVDAWHASFQDAVVHDVVFEDRRTEAMRQARYGVPPAETPYVRTFGNEAVLDQLEAIAHVNDEIERVQAAVSKLAKGPARAMGQRNLDDLTSMRDAMLSLTTGLHTRKFQELRVELNMLIALNDMAREARQELTNGGAGTPLRLKVRGGKLVLKPATSKSRFQKNQIRARNDAARLALLLGESAGTPITLSDIHAKGLGQYEYSTVLSSARTAMSGQHTSWLGARALDIDTCKRASRALQSDLEQTHGGKLLGALPVHTHDDSLLDEVDAGADSCDDVAAGTMPTPDVGAAAPAVILGTFDVQEDGTLVPERKTRSSIASTPAKTSRADAAGGVSAARPRKRAASQRRHRLADEFIAAHSGRAGRLSIILERPTFVERQHEAAAPQRGPVSADASDATRAQTSEERWLRQGARPKTHRVSSSDDEGSPPPLPRTQPPHSG